MFYLCLTFLQRLEIKVSQLKQAKSVRSAVTYKPESWSGITGSTGTLGLIKEHCTSFCTHSTLLSHQNSADLCAVFSSLPVRYVLQCGVSCRAPCQHPIKRSISFETLALLSSLQWDTFRESHRGDERYYCVSVFVDRFICTDEKTVQTVGPSSRPVTFKKWYKTV